MEKISALESELARLKAQIAVYALSEVSNIPAGIYIHVHVHVHIHVHHHHILLT